MRGQYPAKNRGHFARNLQLNQLNEKLKKKDI